MTSRFWKVIFGLLDIVGLKNEWCIGRDLTFVYSTQNVIREPRLWFIHKIIRINYTINDDFYYSIYWQTPKISTIQRHEIFLASSQYGQGKTSECNKQIPQDLICFDWVGFLVSSIMRYEKVYAPRFAAFTGLWLFFDST